MPDEFEYVDLESVVGTEMVSHRTEKKETAPSRAQRLAQSGDVFFQTVRPYQRNNYLFVKPDKNYVFSTGYAQMRPIIDASFLMCFLQTDSFVNVVLDNCTGTSYPAINSNDLSNLSIILPTNQEEQMQIGRMITNLDNLITLHQCKHYQGHSSIFAPQNASDMASFTATWEQRKLGDKMFIKARIGWQRLTKKEYLDSGEYYLITGTDIDEGSHTVDLSRSYYVSRERYEADANIQMTEGDIIVTKDGTIGKVAILKGLDKPATLNSHLFVLRDLSGTLDTQFLLQVLISPVFQDFVESTKTGSTLTGMPQKTIVEFSFLMPSLQEQKNIALLLGKLDNLITLHQCKHYQDHSSVFAPQNASDMTSFTATWEQRKLGEVGKARSGVGFPDVEQGGTSGIPFFKVSDMNNDGNENEMITANNYVTDDQISSRRWSPIEEVPAIFFAKVGAAVMLNRKRLCRFPFLLDNNTMAYSLNKNYWNADFAKALFETVDLTSLVQVGALPSYNAGDVEGIEILLPNLSEQCQIGSYFRQLDDLITLHQRKHYHPRTCDLSSIFDLFLPHNTATWEQRKVADILVERNEQAPKSVEYPLMAFIANEGVAPKGDRYDRSSLVNDTEGKLYKKTEYGDFIYSSNNLETGSIGLNKYGNASISPVYSIFHPTELADSNFIGRRLVRKDFIQEMVKWRQGVIYGQWRIHESDFLKIEIPVPTVEEQRLIGALLDSLDNLITLHQRRYFQHLYNHNWFIGGSFIPFLGGKTC